MTDYVIIVAGGKGLRMGGEVPKQFLPIGGKPVLMRTIERFREYSADLQIILVLPKAQQDYWQDLCRDYDFPLPATTPLPSGAALPLSSRGEKAATAPLPSKGRGQGWGLYQGWAPYLLADGGETRFHSVQHGLALIPDDAQGVVGVHDGVRPFPSIEVIARCYETARQTGAAIPVTPVVETLRHIHAEENLSADTLHSSMSTTVPRSEYRLVQTPQTFDIQLFRAAYRQPYTDMFTDDASVVEAYGHAITLIEGNRENIKLTTPYDLKIAEALL